MSQEEVANFLASVRALDERTAAEDAARLAKMEAGIAIGRAQQAKLSQLSLNDEPPRLPARPRAQQQRSDSADFSRLDRRERELSQQRELENARIRTPSRGDKFRQLQEQRKLQRESQARDNAVEDANADTNSLERPKQSSLTADSPVAAKPKMTLANTSKELPPMPPPARTADSLALSSAEKTRQEEIMPEPIEIPLINPVARSAAKPQKLSTKEPKPSWLASALARNTAPDLPARTKPSIPPSRARTQPAEEPPKLPLRPKTVVPAPEPAPSDIAIGMDRLRRSANSSPERHSRSPERTKEKLQEAVFASPALRKIKPEIVLQKLEPNPQSPQTVLRPTTASARSTNAELQQRPELRKISTKVEPKVESVQLEMSPTSLRKSASQKERYTGADAYLERSPDSLRKSQSQRERYTGADAFVERSPESLKRAERAQRYSGADAYVEKSISALRPAQKRVVSTQKPTEALQRLKELRAKADKPKGQETDKTVSERSSTAAKVLPNSVKRAQTEPSFAGTLDAVLSKGKPQFSESTPTLLHVSDEKRNSNNDETVSRPLVHLSRTRTRGPKRRLPNAGKGAGKGAGGAEPRINMHTPTEHLPKSEPEPAPKEPEQELEIAKRNNDALEAKKARQRRIASEKKRPIKPQRQV